MKSYYFLLTFLIMLSGLAQGQGYVYVNTNNLLLRDRPEKKYMVLAVLHAPSKVKLEKYEDGYKADKAVTAKYYQVSLSYQDKKTGNSVMYNGWIEKKYTVRKLSEITVKGVDTTPDLSAATVNLIPYMGDDEHNPNKMNYVQFPYPKYKGGETKIENESGGKRIYHSGPRGGCYYISSTGRKVYVDKKPCK